MLCCELDSLQSVRCDGNDFHIVYGGQHQTGVTARLLNVISDEHPQFFAMGSLGLRHILFLMECVRISFLFLQ
jgi:hypothetical protein